MKAKSSLGHHRGVALLQVLLLSVIITLLVLQLSYTARGQLALVHEVEQRIQADLLIHSAKNEAAFSLIVSRGTMDAGSLSLVTVPSPSKAGVRLSNSQNGFEVSTALTDVSGLLPLRYPNHPLWPRTLELLGMTTEGSQALLRELSDMQDQDTETEFFSVEPERSSSGFTYPNAPIQMASDLGNWIKLESEVRSIFEPIAHHYTLPTVNLFASPDLITSAALGEFGRRVSGQSINPEDREALRNYLEDSYGLWVGVESSGLWRLEIDVVAESFRRQARFDMSINPRGKVPFTLVGN